MSLGTLLIILILHARWRPAHVAARPQPGVRPSGIVGVNPGSRTVLFLPDGTAVDLAGTAESFHRRKHIDQHQSQTGISGLASVRGNRAGLRLDGEAGGTGEYVDDTVITSKFKAAIFNEPTLEIGPRSTSRLQGRVQLSGFVSSQGAEKRRFWPWARERSRASSRSRTHAPE